MKTSTPRELQAVTSLVQPASLDLSKQPPPKEQPDPQLEREATWGGGDCFPTLCGLLFLLKRETLDYNAKLFLKTLEMFVSHFNTSVSPHHSVFCWSGNSRQAPPRVSTIQTENTNRGRNRESAEGGTKQHDRLLFSCQACHLLPLFQSAGIMDMLTMPHDLFLQPLTGHMSLTFPSLSGPKSPPLSQFSFLCCCCFMCIVCHPFYM